MQTPGARRWFKSAAIQAAARDGANLMPPIVGAVRAWATLGEISDAMRRVFGEYHPASEF